MVEITVPPSKSLSNRALILGLYADLSLSNVLKSDDTKVMLEILPKLGVSVVVKNESDQAMDIDLQPGDSIQADDIIDLYVENAGTATRFLLAALAFRPGKYHLFGNDRMHERPIGDLIEGLRQLGAKVECFENEGFLPLLIEGQELSDQERSCLLKQNVSSQYLSGLLLAAPFWQGETVIQRSGEIVSQSYVDLTIGLLKKLGVTVEFEETSNQFVVAGGQSLGVDAYVVEPDWSSASYWLARSVLEGREFLLKGLSLDSLQGDKKFAEVLVEFSGLSIDETNSGVLLKPGVGMAWPDQIDCVDFPDAAMTLAIVVAVSGCQVELTGLGNLRVKECDRLSALATELAKVVVEVEEKATSLKISGVLPGAIGAGKIETYDDHRMAMCFALLQLLNQEIEILDPGCVSKTYPTFWEDWNLSS